MLAAAPEVAPAQAEPVPAAETAPPKKALFWSAATESCGRCGHGGGAGSEPCSAGIAESAQVRGVRLSGVGGARALRGM